MDDQIEPAGCMPHAVSGARPHQRQRGVLCREKRPGQRTMSLRFSRRRRKWDATFSKTLGHPAWLAWYSPGFWNFRGRPGFAGQTPRVSPCFSPWFSRSGCGEGGIGMLRTS